jgi:steroid delta-isomerase-like uncharacterized protein
MPTEENKAVVRRFIDEIFVQGRVESVDQLAAPDFTPHSWGSVEPGIENLKKAVTRVSAGLSDVSMKIEDMIAEGDKVAVRLTAHAVHSGQFMGHPGTGNEYTISEMQMFRVKDGKVTEHWAVIDQLKQMQQLGLLPTPKPPS